MSELEAQEVTFYLNAVALLMGGYFSYRSQSMIRQPHALVFLLMISVVMLVTRLIVKMPIPYLIIHFTTVVVCMMMLAGIVLWLAHDFKQEAHDKAEQERTKLPEGMERVFDGGAMQVRHSKYGTEVNEDLYYKVQPKQEPKPEPVKEEKKDEYVLDFPIETRYEHQCVIAASGAGKTELFKYQIWHDIQRHDRTVIVMDSQKELIQSIKSLDLPKERLVCLEMSTQWPLALNIFDIKQDRFNEYSSDDQERLKAHALELYGYIFSARGTALTPHQKPFFRNVARLMFKISGSTIFDLRDLLLNGIQDKHKPYLDKELAAFFSSQFKDGDTKARLLARVQGLLESEFFKRMFSYQKTKIDLADEMNIGGKIILIDTNEALLGKDNSAFLGRFFLGLINQVLEERLLIPRHRRMPTFLYIDECADYVDPIFVEILTKARKTNCSMIYATQFFDQFPSYMDSVVEDSGIHLFGRLRKDAPKVAKMFDILPAQVTNLTPGNWFVHATGQPVRSITLPRPPFIERKDQRTDDWAVTEWTRKRYCEKWVESYSTEIIVTEKDPPDYSPKGTNPRNKKT